MAADRGLQLPDGVLLAGILLRPAGALAVPDDFPLQGRAGRSRTHTGAYPEPRAEGKKYLTPLYLSAIMGDSKKRREGS